MLDARHHKIGVTCAETQDIGFDGPRADGQLLYHDDIHIGKDVHYRFQSSESGGMPSGIRAAAWSSHFSTSMAEGCPEARSGGVR